MAECKRWVVTYTKHKKQKRKVYQDGTLELRSSAAKLVLLDECGGVLESRLLKKDEVVESGGMLEFAVHLVVVGDLEGSCKLVVDLTVRGRNEKLIKRSEKFGLDVEEGKNSEGQRVRMQKFQPKFTQGRQAELYNIRAAQINMSTKASTKVCTEWDVLYTTQMTQKAKKYHDGVLKILSCGSQQKCAMLYDYSGKLLNSKFLKNLEVIESGGTVSFDAHIVEIANTRDKSKFLTVSLDVRDKEAPIIEQHKGEVQQDTEREWDVLYTTQMTQKAKKYHDGLLRVSISGSLQKKIILYDDRGALLNSRFLRINEVVETGGNLAFDAQLVEVGAIKNNFMPPTSLHPEVKEEFKNKDCSENCESLNMGSLDVTKRRTENCESSNMGSLDATKRRTAGWLSSNNSPRDATQILSVLRRPASQEQVSINTSMFSHRSESLNLLDPVHLGDQLHVCKGSQSKRSLEANSEDRSLAITSEYGRLQAKSCCKIPEDYADLHNISVCRSDMSKVSNEKSDVWLTDKNTPDQPYFSQHLQGVDSYNCSSLGKDEAEYVVMSTVSNYVDTTFTTQINHSCVKLQNERSLRNTSWNDDVKTVGSMILELGDSRKHILVEPKQNAGAHYCEASISEEESFRGLKGFNEKSMISNDIPSFDLGF